MKEGRKEGGKEGRKEGRKERKKKKKRQNKTRKGADRFLHQYANIYPPPPSVSTRGPFFVGRFVNTVMGMDRRILIDFNRPRLTMIDPY